MISDLGRRRGLVAALRITSIGLWTGIIGVFVGLSQVLPTKLRNRSFDLIMRYWSSGVLLVLGIRKELRGVVPQKPFLLVTNHLGYLDILVLGSITGATFVSRADVQRWPGIGVLAAGVRTIFLTRENRRDLIRVEKEIEDRLEGGGSVIIFPEGTSTAGESVYPLKPGLLRSATRLGHPVHFAALSYRTGPQDPPARESLCWWGDMSFWNHFVGLCSLRRPTAVVNFGPQPVTGLSDRKELALRLQQEISSRFEPVTGSQQRLQ